MCKNSALDHLKKTSAYQEGHYRLKSGLHTNRFLQCAYLTRFPGDTEALCRELANLCRDANADMVIGPALGGMILGYEVSRALGLPFVYTERKNGAMTLRRGFSIPKDAKVLVIEDVVTTGSSLREVMENVRAFGASVAMVASIADRSGGTVNFGVPFVSLLSYTQEQWTEDQCPLCKAGLPIEKPLTGL